MVWAVVPYGGISSEVNVPEVLGHPSPAPYGITLCCFLVNPNPGDHREGKGGGLETDTPQQVLPGYSLACVSADHSLLLIGAQGMAASG